MASVTSPQQRQTACRNADRASRQSLGISCSTVSFHDLSLREALACAADCGFRWVDLDVREGGPVEPVSVREDYETQHLLIGFGAAQAGIAVSSLCVHAPNQTEDEALRLVRSACNLSNALGVGIVTFAPPEPDSLGGLPQWLAAARERETQLRVLASGDLLVQLLDPGRPESIALSLSDLCAAARNGVDLEAVLPRVHCLYVDVRSTDEASGEWALTDEERRLLAELTRDSPDSRVVLRCCHVADLDWRKRLLSRSREATRALLAS